MKARITDEGLLIPREGIERLGSEEVEISEEPGRVLIFPARGLVPVTRMPRREGSPRAGRIRSFL